MTQGERDSLNKKIAEDLGWREIESCTCDRGILRGISPNNESGNRGRRHIPNITDPSLTLMLMEKMLANGQAYWIQHDEDGYQFEAVNSSKTYRSDTIGEAVALAYAKMKGLTNG